MGAAWLFVIANVETLVMMSTNKEILLEGKLLC